MRRLTAAGDPSAQAEGRQALADATAALAHRAGAASLLGGRAVTEAFLDLAARVPVRDLDQLRRHHGGLEDEQLADALVTAATRATTAVGAALGAVVAAQYAAPPLLLSAPVQLAAETVAVAAIETKLVAELHAVYGVPAPGGGTGRAVPFVGAWVEQRGIDPLDPATAAAALGVLGKRRLRRRLARRIGTSLPALAPVLAGAVAGGAVNRRETQVLAAKVRADLRRRSAAAHRDRP